MVLARSAALATLFVLSSAFMFAADPFEARTNPGANIIIEGDAGFSNPFVRGSGTSQRPYVMQDLDVGAYNIQIKNTTSYVILRNITFTQSTRHAVYMYNADNVVLDNVTCSDRSKFVYFGSGSGLIIRDSIARNVRSNLNLVDIVSSDQVTIMGSRFMNRTGERGAWISFDATTMRSAVEDCVFWGVGIKDNAFTANNRIERCDITDHGITLDNTAPGGCIQNCTISYPVGNAIAVNKADRIDIKDSWLEANYGIYFTGSGLKGDGDYGRIDNNTFESCNIGIGGFSNWQNQPSRFFVTDNYFGNCTGMAISWEMGTNNRMWDNIFYHNSGTGDSGSSPQATEGFQWGGNANLWSYGGKGNYWQNHRYPDADGNGIVDVNYTLVGSVQDTAPYTNRYFDTSRPDIAIISPAGKYASNIYTVVRISAADIGSGIAGIQKSSDGSHWVGLSDPTATSFYLKKGTNDIHFRVFDRAGLVRTLKKIIEVNASIDPLRFDFPTEGSFVKSDPMEMRWSAIFQLIVVNQTLHLDGVQHYLDPAVSIFQTDLPEGSHFVRLTVRDPYGMTINRTANFTIDLTKPTLDVLSPQHGSVLSNPLVGFRVNSFDSIALKSVAISIDDIAWPTFDPGITNNRMLAPGDHKLVAVATDSAGWSTARTIVFTITEEGSQNGLSFIDPSPNGTYTPSDSHMVTWDYYGSFLWNVAKLRVSSTGQFVNIHGSRNWEVSLPEEGAYELTLRLVDGYENYVETKGYLFRDSTPPKVFIPMFPDGARVHDGEFVLNWTTIDASPVVSYDYTIDGGSPVPTNKTSVALALAEGAHSILVRAFDAAGNMGDVLKEIIIDTTPTTVALNSPTQGSVYDGTDLAVRWDLSDTSDISDLVMFLDNETPIDIIDKVSMKIDIVGEGLHTIRLECTDRAGNIWTHSVSFMVDRNDPEVGWNATLSEYTNTTMVRLSFFARDRIGIASLMLDIDRSFTNVSGLEYYDLNLSEGSHGIALRATDLAGRTTSTEVWTIVVDLLRPALNISERSVEEGKATFRWIASDDWDIDSFSISVDGGQWQAGASEGIFTSDKLSPGSHSIRAMAVDKAGNRQSFEWAFNVSSTGGIEVPREEGSSFPWWVVPVGLGAVIVIAVVVTALVLTRRPKEEQSARRSGPRKLSIGAIPAAVSTELPSNPPEGLPGAKVEDTEEGSGYIRPKSRERPAKKPRKISQVERTQEGPITHDVPAQAPMPAPAPMTFTGGEDAHSPFAEAPIQGEEASVYYKSPSSAPEPELVASDQSPPSREEGPCISFDEDAEPEFEEIEEFETLEE